MEIFAGIGIVSIMMVFTTLVFILLSELLKDVFMVKEHSILYSFIIIMLFFSIIFAVFKVNPEYCGYQKIEINKEV